MQYLYDTNGMKGVSSSVAQKLREFQTHADAIESLVAGLHASWMDPVNQRFTSQYLNKGLVTCNKLEKTIKAYSDIMSQCANRYGSAIDNGNRFFNSF